MTTVPPPPPSRRRTPTLASRLDTLVEGVGVAWEAIRTNRIRASLTILGVGIGVAVVVTMAALITGVRSSIADSVESSGPDNFSVMRFDPSGIRIQLGDDRPPWEGRPVVTEDEAALVDALPGVDQALYVTNLSVNVEYQGSQFDGILARGISSGWPAFSEGDFVAGRDFTTAEVLQSRPVIVISTALSDKLFPGLDPIGRRIRVTSPNRPVREDFEVVGVYRQEENIFSPLIEDWAVLPYSSALKRLKASRAEGQILVVPEADAQLPGLRDQVTATMRTARRLGPRDENNFDLISSRQLLELFDQFTSVFVLIILALSSVGLMVGGVGVVGIMLISVTERTREIGVRKALGATRREILWQFLVEASTLTILGAAVGLLLGAGLAYGVAALTPIPARIPLWSVVVSLVAAGLTGIVFGILPARRAARLQPVEALRAE